MRWFIAFNQTGSFYEPKMQSLGVADEDDGLAPFGKVSLFRTTLAPALRLKFRKAFMSAFKSVVVKDRALYKRL